MEMIADDKKQELEGRSRAWRRVWRYGPLVIWMVFIFFASTAALSGANTSRIIRPLLLWLFPGISEERLALAHFLTRKVAHFLEYAVLALLAARAFHSSSQPFVRRRWFFVSLLLVVVYSLSDEYHQSFVPARGASLYDSFIDMAGGLTALLIYAWRGARRKTGLVE